MTQATTTRPNTPRRAHPAAVRAALRSRIPGIEGFQMKVFANSVTFPDGTKTGPLVV